MKEILIDCGYQDIQNIPVLPNPTFGVEIIREFSRDKYEFADFMGILIDEERRIEVPIFLPSHIKNQNFAFYESENFIFKETWPKIPNTGDVGIYYKHKHSDFGLTLFTFQCDLLTQNKILQIGKTFQFKKWEKGILKSLEEQEYNLMMFRWNTDPFFMKKKEQEK